MTKIDFKGIAGMLQTAGNTAKIFLRNNAPTIMVVGGAIGCVGSAVMACNATLKIDEVLEKDKEDIDKIHKYKDEHGFSEKYTMQDYNHDLTMCYIRAGGKLVKLYGLSVTTMAASIAMILGSHKMMSDRNTQLATAYTTLSTMYKQYRDRVKERFGEEVEKDIFFNRVEEKEKVEYVGEDGKKHKKTETVKVTKDPVGLDPYAKVFCPPLRAYPKDSDPNSNEGAKRFMVQAEDALNWKLQAQRYLYVTDVLDYFGYPRNVKTAKAFAEITGDEYYLFLNDDVTLDGIGWLYDPLNEVDPDRVVNKDTNRICLNVDASVPGKVFIHLNPEGYIKDKVKDYARY